MLRIYPVILAFVGDVYPFIERMGRHDPDLVKQLRRASASVALNTAERMYARGRQRAASYNIALREMRERVTRRSKSPSGSGTSRRCLNPSSGVSHTFSVRWFGSRFLVSGPAKPEPKTAPETTPAPPAR